MKIKFATKILPILLVTALVFSAAIPAFAQESTSAASPKEEVIYVNIAADGTVKAVYAVNIFGGGSIVDYGDYSEIKNLNTSDKITQDGNKITLSSSADRVYYQGKLNSTVIPWNISIRYFIDGTEYSASDVAGKSGKLEIRFVITENENAGGDLYDTYALQASFTLDTNKCSNITAAGATIANVGGNKQISYTVLPGKGLDATVTADVRSFEMGAISINGVRLALDIEVDCDELLDEVRKLLDAVAELDDGAGELKDGAYELKDGAAELDSGARDLIDGVGELKDGADELSGGATELAGGARDLLDGAEELKDGANTLKGGISDANNGVIELESGLSELSDNSDGIRTGAYQVFVSLTTSAQTQLHASLTAAGFETVTLTPENYGAVLDGLAETLSAYAYAQAEATARAEIRSQVEAVFEAIIRDQVEAEVREQVRTAITGDTAVMAEINASVESAYGSEINTLARDNIALEVANRYSPDDPEGWLSTAEGQATVAAYLASAEGQAAYMSVRGQIKEQYVNAAVETQLEAQMATEAVQTTVDQNTEAQMSNDEIQAQISAEVETKMASEEVQAQISEGAQTGLTWSDAYKGVVSLKAQLDSYNEFYTGLNAYTQGIDSAADGATELKNGMSDLVQGATYLADGASDLYDGSAELKNGTDGLVSGAEELKNGVSELYDGAVELKDGTGRLLDGAGELYDGCTELKDGTAEMRSETDGMDTKIQNKIDEMINEITGGDATVRSFVSDANTDVESLQFVIQSESIDIPEVAADTPATKKELNFWQKLLKLFGLYKED